GPPGSRPRPRRRSAPPRPPHSRRATRGVPSSRQTNIRASTPRYIRRMHDDETLPSPMIEVRPGYLRASWPMAAAAVILDEKDRVLLVQPVYYSGRWLM